MDRDQRARTYRWGMGGCAALAMAAGTAMAQQQPDQAEKDKHEKMQHKEQGADQSKQQGAVLGMQEEQQGWKSASTLPGLRSDLILVGKTKEDKSVQVVFDNGRLVEATHENQPIQHDKIQIKENKIRVMGESNNELVTFKLPGQILASGGDVGFEQDRFDQDRFATVPNDPERFDRMQQDRFSQDNYAGGPFPQEQQRTSRTWSTQDRWSTEPYQPREQWRSDMGSQWDSQRAWEMRNSQDNWNTRDDRFQMEHRQSRQFETQPRYDRDMQFRSDSRFERQPTFRSADEMRGSTTQRMYGTTSEGRPVVLGIILDEADASQLRQSNYDRGLRVQRVRQGMAAEQAGLREGDVIVLIDNQPADTRILERRLSTTTSEPVRFKVLRDGNERDVLVTSSSSNRGMADDASIFPRDTDMPHIDQPGPFNVYRPTRPEEFDDHSGRRIYSDYEMRSRDLDRDRDVYIYDRDDTWRDRNMNQRDRDSIELRDRDVYFRDRDTWRDQNASTWGDRDAFNRTYNTGEIDVYRDRDFDTRTYYVRPDTDTRFETRTYYTGRDWDDNNMRMRGDDNPEMPNERHPGPFNLYRPTRPSVDDSNIYRPSDRR